MASEGAIVMGMREKEVLPTPPTRAGKAAGDEGGDVCEMLLTELRARRQRLADLLALVHREAERSEAPRVPAHRHSRRGRSRMARTA